MLLAREGRAFTWIELALQSYYHSLSKLERLKSAVKTQEEKDDEKFLETVPEFLKETQNEMLADLYLRRMCCELKFPLMPSRQWMKINRLIGLLRSYEKNKTASTIRALMKELGIKKSTKNIVVSITSKVETLAKEFEIKKNKTSGISSKS